MSKERLEDFIHNGGYLTAVCGLFTCAMLGLFGPQFWLIGGAMIVGGLAAGQLSPSITDILVAGKEALVAKLTGHRARAPAKNAAQTCVIVRRDPSPSEASTGYCRDGNTYEIKNWGGPYYNSPSGTCYYRNGKLHRDDGPANVYGYPQGTNEEGVLNVVEYCCDGVLHRDGGPARYVSYNTAGQLVNEYYRNGLLHREDGPAIVRSFPGGAQQEEYYRNGQRHREGGPAVIWFNPDEGRTVASYYLNGKLTQAAQTWIDGQLVSGPAESSSAPPAAAVAPSPPAADGQPVRPAAASTPAALVPA